MRRPTRLSDSVALWPSTLFQTATLELIRGGERLLVDPGVSPWEIREAAGDSVSQVVITHADWDHVLGIGILRAAEVTASRGAAERLGAAGVAAEIEAAAADYYVPVEALDRMRVDRVVDPPADLRLGPWTALAMAAPGHTSDGIAISFPDEDLLVVGDHLSELEIPFAHSSTLAYRDTLRQLITTIERDRPAYVVVGHGPPHDSERALEIARADLEYLEAVISFAGSGGSPEDAGRVPTPRRAVVDAEEHMNNVRRACEEVTSP